MGGDVETATAVPMPMNPVPMNVGGGLFTAGVGYNPPNPAGRWKAALCQPSGMCWAAFCCPFITAPQTYAKYLGQPRAFRKWAVIVFVFYAAYLLLGQVAQNTPVIFESTGQIDTTMYFVFSSGSNVCYLISAFVITFLLMTVRKLVRNKDNIPAASCGEMEDCCCSFWCPCCTTIQIFAQGEISCQNGYQLCSPEGVPTASELAI